jgi:hypothetical protein
MVCSKIEYVIFDMDGTTAQGGIFGYWLTPSPSLGLLIDSERVTIQAASPSFPLQLDPP